MPYVKAGCAVLAYELDGPCYDDGDPDEMKQPYRPSRHRGPGWSTPATPWSMCWPRFLKSIPAQIYAAGHSSAATHALLFAAHEPRLAGVIAYAPAADVPKRIRPAAAGLSLS